MRFIDHRPIAVLLTLVLLVGVGAGASAQEPVSPAPAAEAEVEVEADSLQVSPRAAMLRSLLLPGLGQAYVGVPGRGAVYFALESASLWMVYKSSRGLAAAREQEAFLRDRGEIQAGERLPLASSRAQQVEDWITFSVFWAFFAAADAYVAAQLSDFAAQVGVGPAADGALEMRARVPLGGAR